MEVLVELLSQKIVRFVIKHETWQDDTLACGSFSDIGPAAKRLFKKIRVWSFSYDFSQHENEAGKTIVCLQAEILIFMIQTLRYLSEQSQNHL